MARRRLNAQGGFTLVEVLLVSSLFLVILTATAMSMTSFERENRDHQRLDDQAERARRSVQRGMRQLRNLANRAAGSTTTIARADDDDFVFQTSDPNRTWVRYCTEARADGTYWLWGLINQLNSPAAPTDAACPGSWPRRDPVARNVTNYVNGRSNALFTYGRNCASTLTPAQMATCQASLGTINSVRMDLLLDDNLLKEPTEARVSSAVFLRNQNEPPTATFTVTGGMGRQVLFNASGAADPEGRTLRYYWYRSPAPATFSCSSPPNTSDPTVLGLGVTLTYTFSSADGAIGTDRNFTLIVCDPGDLRADYTAPVTIR